MEFLKTILSRSKLFYVFLLTLGFTNSMLNTGLLVFINKSILGEPFPYFPEYDWLIFIALIISSILISRAFQIYIIGLTNDLLCDFELAVLQKLRFSSFEQFEKLGKERVYTAMNDVRVLSNLPEVFINAFNAFILILCSMIYMFVTSYIGGAMVLLLMGLLLVFYLVRNNQVEKQLLQLRDLNDSFYRYLIDMLLGFKEIKMSIFRNENIYSKYIRENSLNKKLLNVKTSKRYMENEITGSYSWYLVLGFIIFALPQIANVQLADVSTFIVIILFLIGPVAVLITLVPTINNVKVALTRLDKFNDQIKGDIGHREDFGDPLDEREFKSVRFEEVYYEYQDENGEKVFSVGPITLEIKAGTLTFIVGGNGSGKSTLIKLLTGLYLPKSGNIYLNDELVAPENFAYYSDKISAIFTDNHLFSENYDDFDLDSMNGEISDFMEVMRLNEVVRREGNKFDHKLSKGQQKRMAMVYTLLENKEMIVLDEWAAEQDPVFRAFFYNELLQDLQAKGKTLVVITHDDYYYDQADRILKLNYGNIESDLTTRKKEELSHEV